MKILKVTFFPSGSHKIEPVVCSKLTHGAAIISRSSDEMARDNTTEPKTFTRETGGVRFCATIGEAKDFLDAKYTDKVGKMESNLSDVKARYIAMIEIQDEEVAA